MDLMLDFKILWIYHLKIYVNLIDEGKKEIGEGLVIIYAINDNKVGLAVGVTKTLEEKFDAVKIVRAGSEDYWGKRWWWQS